MRPARPLLLVGVTDPQVVDSYGLSARQAGLDMHVVATPDEAQAWLESHDPHAIALDMMADGAEDSCLGIRAIARLAPVPVIGLIPELNDLAFPEMYGWGGDDVARVHHPLDLVPRLRSLVFDGSLAPPAPKGAAVVADSDRRRRGLYARVLRNAGYDVRFALDASEAVSAARNETARIIIVDADLEATGENPRTSGVAGGVDVAQRIRAEGLALPVVIPAAPKTIASHRAAIEELTKVAITDRFAPPENLLFVANELVRGDASDGRASPRLLYGTVVAFRPAGRREEVFGCTYNISAGGLYVRTLAPLESGQDVWLELRPPRCDRFVRLEGTVVWRRRFGPIESATVPPGFGLHITDGSQGDLARFETGYRAFAADTFGEYRGFGTDTYDR